MTEQSFVQKLEATRAERKLSFPLVHHFADAAAEQPAFLQVDISQPSMPGMGHWKDRELLLSLEMEPQELAQQDALIVTIDAMRAPNVPQLHQICADAPKFGADYVTAIYDGINKLHNDDHLQFKAVMKREDASRLLEQVSEQTGVELPSVARHAAAQGQGRGR